MLLSQPQDNKPSFIGFNANSCFLRNKWLRAGALMTAILVNLTLAALIYGLTIGSKIAPVNDVISINFRQFTDSAVEEQTLEPELTVIPEKQPELNQLPTPTVQPSIDVPKINLNSSISMPVLAMPEFSVSPSLDNISVPDMSVAPVTPTVVKTLGKVATPTIGFAKVLRKVQPQYPYKAQRLKIEGHVLLHILIDDEGSPLEIKVIEEQPRGYFAQSARKAIRRWHFEKAPQGQEVWKKWRLAFELN